VPEDRRLTDLQMDVAGAAVDRVPEQREQIHPNLIGRVRSAL
jgi:hypothetical protein